MKLKYWLRSKIYRYASEKYCNTFLVHDNNPAMPELKPTPKVIYCFWTGDNELTANRIKGLQRMEAETEMPLKLITPHNLHGYILPEHPLHPGYEFLSAVHRSDYLRCYFMHHYGGGYSDIKPPTASWVNAFLKLDESSKWVAGYPEIGKRVVAKVKDENIKRDLKKYWPLLIGNGSYICRPYTPFTYDWYAELHKRMDMYYDDLKKNPGNIWGDNEGYPIPWTNILGEIFHPLCLKYHKQLIKDKSLMPVLTDYR